MKRAAERIQSYFVRDRLVEHDSAIEAYQKGGMVKADIDGILAAEFCQALLAPVVEAYEDEKDRILGKRLKQDLQDLWDFRDWELSELGFMGFAGLGNVKFEMVVSEIRSLYRNENDLFRTVIKLLKSCGVGYNECRKQNHF